MRDRTLKKRIRLVVLVLAKKISLRLVTTVITFFSLMSCAIAEENKAVEKLPADLLVLGEYVLPMNDETNPSAIIRDGAVTIRNNEIIAVGPRLELEAKYQSKTKIEGDNRVLMPGLINGHTHTAMTLFKGMADDLELMPWLNNYIFPMEGKFVKPEFVRVGTELACYEMIRGGITSFVDMYFYPEIISEQTVNCGLRAVVAAPMIDFPSPGFKGWDDSFAAGMKYVEQWQGKHERITPAFGPHAPYTVSPEHIQQVAEKSRELNVPISMHIAESKAESEMIAKNHQSSPVAHIDNQSMFDDNQVIAAHMVHPNEKEMTILAKNKVGAIHNPTSNLKLAAGISPVTMLLKKGVSVGLGTDGAASNNDLDLWEEIRLAALLHKVKENDPTVVPAITAIQLATSIGARAVGLGKQVGQLRIGYKADMIQVSLDDLRLQPIYNVVSHLAYAVDSHDVVTTIVSGNVLMKERKVLTVDENKLRHSVKAISDKISRELKK